MNNSVKKFAYLTFVFIVVGASTECARQRGKGKRINGNMHYQQAHEAATQLDKMVNKTKNKSIGEIMATLQEFLDHELLLVSEANGIRKKAAEFGDDFDETSEIFENTARRIDYWIEQLWDIMPMEELAEIKQKLEEQMSMEDHFIDVVERAESSLDRVKQAAEMQKERDMQRKAEAKKKEVRKRKRRRRNKE